MYDYTSMLELKLIMLVKGAPGYVYIVSENGSSLIQVIA